MMMMRNICRCEELTLTVLKALPLTKAQPRIRMLTEMIPDSIQPQFRPRSLPVAMEAAVASGSRWAPFSRSAASPSLDRWSSSVSLSFAVILHGSNQLPADKQLHTPSSNTRRRLSLNSSHQKEQCAAFTSIEDYRFNSYTLSCASFNNRSRPKRTLP